MADTQLHHPIELGEKYKLRPIRFLHLGDWDGWHVKVYGISARQEQPDSQLIAAAERLAGERLPRPAVSKGRYGVGILIGHEGRDGNYVLVSWWIEENLLQHHVYFSPATLQRGLLPIPKKVYSRQAVSDRHNTEATHAHRLTV